MSMSVAAEAVALPEKKPYTLSPGKLAMWLFLASDAMGFMGLIGAYMVLRIAAPLKVLNEAGEQIAGGWHKVGDPSFGIDLTAFMTFVLICSSVTMVKALAAISRGDQKKLIFWLGCTIGGGLFFLGCQVYEWSHLMHAGLSPSNRDYGATFFFLTGFHGLHVSTGVIYLSCIWIKSRRGGYTADSHSPVELVGLFWHFVDLVWIVLFTIVYLLPEPPGIPVAGG